MMWLISLSRKITKTYYSRFSVTSKTGIEVPETGGLVFGVIPLPQPRETCGT